MRGTICVLVVDDNERDREVIAQAIKMAFEQLGLEVEVFLATSAGEVFRLIEEGRGGKPISLVTIDYQLVGWGRDGDMFAWEITTVCEEHQGVVPPPIIAICGDPEDFKGVSVVGRDPLRFSSGQRVQAAVKKAQEADELTGYDFSKALTDALRELLF